MISVKTVYRRNDSAFDKERDAVIRAADVHILLL